MSYCRCRLCEELDEMDRKFAARIILADNSRQLIIPTRGEWIGLNLLERDDQLARKDPRTLRKINED